jgi:hypothetical protein
MTVPHHLQRARGALLLAALIVAGCGGAEVLLIPLFEFGFAGTAGAVQVQAFFLPDTPTTPTGTFTGVNMNFDATQLHYSGTWSSCSVKLTADAVANAAANVVVTAPASDSYDGRFKGNDTIELRPPSSSGLPVLTLVRQSVEPKQTGC